MHRTSEAQSYCADGDIQLVAGEHKRAAAAFLQAHIADSVATKEHLSSVTDEQRDDLLVILHCWVDSDSQE